MNSVLVEARRGGVVAAIGELSRPVFTRSAIDIDDGNNARAAEVVIAAVIEAAPPRADADAALLRGFSGHALHDWNGLAVGALRASDIRRCGLAPATAG